MLKLHPDVLNFKAQFAVIHKIRFLSGIRLHALLNILGKKTI